MYFLDNRYVYIEIVFIWGIFSLIPFYYKQINDHLLCFISYCELLISFFTFCIFFNSERLRMPVNVLYLFSILTGFISYWYDGYHFEFITIVNLVRIHYYYLFLTGFLIKKVYVLFLDSYNYNVQVVLPPHPEKINIEEVEVSLSVNSCRICYTNEYKKINLVCNHTLCENCIYELRKNQNEKCPFCRGDLLET